MATIRPIQRFCGAGRCPLAHFNCPAMAAIRLVPQFARLCASSPTLLACLAAVTLGRLQSIPIRQPDRLFATFSARI